MSGKIYYIKRLKEYNRVDRRNEKDQNIKYQEEEWENEEEKSFEFSAEDVYIVDKEEKVER